MSSEGPNPLAPYWPSETPSIPGNGRTWFALALLAVLLFGTVLWLVSLLLRLVS